MRVRVEKETSVPPDELYRWWTDFRDGGADHAFLGHATRASAHVRRRVRPRADGRIDIEDRGRFLGMPLHERYTVSMHPGTREVRLYGANNFARFTAVYRFETGKAVLDADVAPLAILAAFDRLLAPAVRRFLERDLEGHLADAAADAEASGPPPPGPGRPGGAEAMF